MADDLIQKMDTAAAKMLDKLSVKTLEVSENPNDNSAVAEMLSIDQEIKIFTAVAGWMATKNRINPDDGKNEGGINDFKRELKADSDQRKGDLSRSAADNAAGPASNDQSNDDDAPARPAPKPKPAKLQSREPSTGGTELDQIKEHVRRASAGGVPRSGDGAGGESASVGGRGRRVSIGVPLGQQSNDSQPDGSNDL